MEQEDIQFLKDCILTEIDNRRFKDQEINSLFVEETVFRAIFKSIKYCNDCLVDNIVFIIVNSIIEIIKENRKYKDIVLEYVTKYGSLEDK